MELKNNQKLIMIIAFCTSKHNYQLSLNLKSIQNSTLSFKVMVA